MKCKKCKIYFSALLSLCIGVTTDPVTLNILTINLNIRDNTNPRIVIKPSPDQKYFGSAHLDYGSKHKDYGLDYTNYDAEAEEENPVDYAPIPTVEEEELSISESPNKSGRVSGFEEGSSGSGYGKPSPLAPRSPPASDLPSGPAAPHNAGKHPSTPISLRGKVPSSKPTPAPSALPGSDMAPGSGAKPGPGGPPPAPAPPGKGSPGMKVDTWMKGGDTWVKEGDSWMQQEGEAWMEAGDSWMQEGDDWRESEGESWMEGGDAWMKQGDSWKISNTSDYSEIKLETTPGIGSKNHGSGSESGGTGSRSGECVKEDHIEYADPNIAAVKAEGVDKCAHLCNTFQLCRFWTFNKVMKHCFLKASNSKPKNELNVISGTRSCATGPGSGSTNHGSGSRSGECLKEINIEFTGFDVDGKKLDSIDECANFCQTLQPCKFWTFYLAEKKCLAKTSNSIRKPLLNVISGTRRCATGPGSGSGSGGIGFGSGGKGSGSGSKDCVKEDNIEYIGFDVTEKVVSGAEECAQFCQILLTCKFWTFKKAVKLCSLKTSNVQKRKNDEVISGARSCAEGAGSSSGSGSGSGLGSGEHSGSESIECVKEGNIEYIGDDIGKKKVAGDYDCAKECGKVPSCKFWTFNIVDMSCYMKSSDSRRNKANNVLSGSKGCSSGSGSGSGSDSGSESGSGKYSESGYIECEKEGNIEYTGNDIGNKTVEGDLDCAKECEKVPACKFWTFNLADMHCYMKSANSSRKREDNVISGNKACASGDGSGDDEFWIGSGGVYSASGSNKSEPEHWMWIEHLFKLYLNNYT